MDEIEWFPEALREEWTARWQQEWASAHWNEGFVAAGAAASDAWVVAGVAGVRRRRLSEAPCPLVVLEHPELGHALLPSLVFPPMAMIRAADLTRALADYRQPSRPAWALPGRYRVCVPLELESVDAIASTLEAVEPWMDDTWYGSAHDDDPYDAMGDPPRQIDRILARRTALDQHPNRVDSWSVRTLWSRSVVRIEQHPHQLWVFHVSYPPVGTDPDAAVRLSGSTGFPADLPIDVVPCLLRTSSLFPCDTVRGAFDHPPEPYTLAVGCALAHGDPGLADPLDRYATTFAGTEHEALAVDILANFDRWSAVARLGVASAGARSAAEDHLGGEA
ncbi:MAG: hypothetical protein ABMA64_03550 [Myxococcota bacterium]